MSLTGTRSVASVRIVDHVVATDLCRQNAVGGGSLEGIECFSVISESTFKSRLGSQSGIRSRTMDIDSTRFAGLREAQSIVMLWMRRD